MTETLMKLYVAEGARVKCTRAPFAEQVLELSLDSEGMHVVFLPEGVAIRVLHSLNAALVKLHGLGSGEV